MSMENILQNLATGIMVGGLYGLIGIGLSIIFGVMRIINFAHGAFVMMGMYIAYLLFDAYHINPYLALAVCIPLMFWFGVATEKLLVRRLIGANPESQLLLTLGLGLILSNGTLLVFTPNDKMMTLNYGALALGGIRVSWTEVISFAITLVVAVSLYIYLMASDGGRAIRAVSQDRDAARLMGINVERISARAFGLGTALAGIAGLLLLPVTGSTNPYVGTSYTLKSFVVTVLGGMGSLLGAMVAGQILGIAESIGIGVLGIPSAFRDLIGLSLFLIILLFRPGGLMGRTRV